MGKQKMFVLDFLVVTSTILCLGFGLGSALTLDISPSHVNGLIHDDVTMTCRLDNSDGAVKEVMVLELSRNDVAAVILRAKTQLTIENGVTSKFQNADGKICASAVFDSFISVTLFDPEVKDSGSYTCLMYFLNQGGVLEEKKQSANLTVSDTDMVFAVKYLVGKVSGLENELGDVKNQLDIQKNQSGTRENQLQGQINSLANEIKMQGKQLAQLSDKANTNVLFVALHDQAGNFQKGKVLVFSDTLVNIGGCYDSKTGMFTAPVAGFYLFHVSIILRANTWIYIDLKSSQGAILTRIRAGDNHFDYSTGSCVALLRAGEQVMPVIRDQSAPDVVGLDNSDRMNKFSAYLLKAT